MNRYFRPQVESLEERMVMNAAPQVSPIGYWGRSEVNGVQTDRSVAEHELGHALGFQHEHLPPASASDDVWIDGKIITAENYSSSPLNSSAGAGLDILIGNTGGDRTDNNGHGSHVAGTIGSAPSSGANFLFGDGSVRFVSDGISSDPAQPDPKSLLAGTEAPSGIDIDPIYFDLGAEIESTRAEVPYYLKLQGVDGDVDGSIYEPEIISFHWYYGAGT